MQLKRQKYHSSEWQASRKLILWRPVCCVPNERMHVNYTMQLHGCFRIRPMWNTCTNRKIPDASGSALPGISANIAISFTHFIVVVWVFFWGAFPHSLIRLKIYDYLPFNWMDGRSFRLLDRCMWERLVLKCEKSRSNCHTLLHDKFCMNVTHAFEVCIYQQHYNTRHLFAALLSLYHYAHSTSNLTHLTRYTDR